MATEEEAQKAVEMFHEQDFIGRNIIVNEARPKTEGGSRGMGGGRGRFQGGNRRFGGDTGGRGRFNRDDRQNGERNNDMAQEMNHTPMDVDPNDINVNMSDVNLDQE